MKPCLLRASNGDCSSAGDVKMKLPQGTEPMPLIQWVS